MPDNPKETLDKITARDKLLYFFMAAVTLSLGIIFCILAILL